MQRNPRDIEQQGKDTVGQRRRSGHTVRVLDLEAAGFLIGLVSAAAVVAVVAADRLEVAVDADLALAKLALAVLGAGRNVLGEGDNPVSLLEEVVLSREWAWARSASEVHIG